MDAMTSLDFATLRKEMVDRQIAARGVRDRRVLEALATVPREAFLPERLAEFAYDDTPLPIGQEQTISQPYVVALMAEALELQPGDEVLEIGAGSGYAAAVLSRIAREVWTLERHESLAREARERMARLGYANVHVIHGDGTLGWPEHAPYDAIVVAAGGPEVPQALLDQLAPGGRLVIPIGPEPRTQSLVRVRRRPDGTHAREDLGGVRFVPLIGAQGWREEGGVLTPSPSPQAPVVGVDGPPGEPVTENPAAEAARAAEAAAGVRPVFGELAPAGPPPEIVLREPRPAGPVEQVAKLVREEAEPFDDIETADLDALLERIGDSRVVLLGEATHGTSEFYRFRARLTRELIVRKGFNLVAVEADWPDAAQIDRYVRDRQGPPAEGSTFARFPTWMWRNREVRDFTHWLREHNLDVREPERKVSFHGLDVYSLYGSIAAVLRYLQGVDPEAARVARLRYGCLTPWERDPALYGQAALTRRFPLCEAEVLTTLQEMLEKRLDYVRQDGERYLDAVQNARIVANAERYYRAMYYGSAESWNLRDRHMFDTLLMLLDFRGREGREAKGVVWEHNSHVGNAGATEMGARGELNVGQLARDHFRDGAYLVGFGTDHGTVAAATDWDGEMEIKRVRPAHPESYERLGHESGVPAFLLHLREPRRAELREELEVPRLERAIGVIYRPETELLSHYFQAVLPWQFDEYVWIDETRAVSPLAAHEVAGMPETYPFGL